MTNPYIGIIGTVIGTILGFSLTWLKGYIDDRKKLILRISPVKIKAVLSTPNTYNIYFDFDIIVTNNSIVKQPVWGIHLLWEKFPDKKIVPFNGIDDCSSIKIDSKSVQHYQCDYKIHYNTEGNINPDEYRDKKLKLFFKTRSGEKKKSVPYSFSAIMPPMPPLRSVAV